MPHPFLIALTAEHNREEQRIAYEEQVQADRDAAMTNLATQKAAVATALANRINGLAAVAEMNLTPQELASLGDVIATAVGEIHLARLAS